MTFLHRQLVQQAGIAANLCAAVYGHSSQPELWYGWLAWAVLLLIPLGLVFAVSRRVWKRLAADLAKVPAALVEVQKPSTLSARLTTSKTREILQLAVELIGRTTQRLGVNVDPQLSAVLLGEVAVGMVRDLLAQALHSSEVESLLLETGGQSVYVMVFPGRHEHAQLLRRYAGLSQGWLNHAAELRRCLAGQESGKCVHCCLIFLRQDARDSICVYCLEQLNLRFADETILDQQELQTPGVQHWADASELSLVH